MEWPLNTILLKVICRGVWLCKLIYPVIYTLTLNKPDLRHTSTTLNIIEMQLPSISAISTTIYKMTWSLFCSANFAHELNLNQKQIRASTEQNSIKWCQQCNKPGAIGRIEYNLLKGYELRSNYVKNTTSVSSCDLGQVPPTKYPN